MTQKLFVYGSLGPGRPNEHILTAIGGTWQPATIKGHLKQCGWGAEMGYPAIVLDNDGEDVSGFIFSSEDLTNHWDELDEFEGDGYERIIAKIILDDHNSTDAYIYVLKKR